MTGGDRGDSGLPKARAKASIQISTKERVPAKEELAVAKTSFSRESVEHIARIVELLDIGKLSVL